MEEESIKNLRWYHRVSKHTTSAYAPSPGFLDWESQPKPFRRYSGAPLIHLPLGCHGAKTEFPSIPDRMAISRMLELAFGLSAWKSTGQDTWALRHNPSSGNLHPTEAYLILWTAIDDELTPGVYHYSAYEHGLERRNLLPEQLVKSLAELSGDCFGAVGLSSIIWREEWKYGSRALRYCLLDAGHALGALAYAASCVGWSCALCRNISDAQLRACLGLQHIPAPAEAEHPEMLVYLSAKGFARPEQPLDFDTFQSVSTPWLGKANCLSKEHVHWPQIAQVLPCLEKHSAQDHSFAEHQQRPIARDEDLPTLIRRRRSAQRMLSGHGITLQDFFKILESCMPQSALPFSAFSYPPCINLVIFVHQVEGLSPGVYLLERVTESTTSLREGCKNVAGLWQTVNSTVLPLYRLGNSADYRKTASTISCYQAIAGHGAFSLGMLANMGDVIKENGAWAYRRIFYEAGLIGQALYLQAEAVNVNGTGIGCFFDDSMHQLLGLEAEGSWQDVYHFTVGKARIDERLTTLPGYYHLKGREQ